MAEIKRIALIGPEATGKSTLCKQLAEHYATVWNPEYAREFLRPLNREYTLADVERITIIQAEREDNAKIYASRFLFADTEEIISKVWCERKFGSCPEWILKKIIERRYNLYLLLRPDLPWEPDPLRENPHLRNELFNDYRNNLLQFHCDFEIVDGLGSTRLENCIKAIETKFPPL